MVVKPKMWFQDPATNTPPNVPMGVLEWIRDQINAGLPKPFINHNVHMGNLSEVFIKDGWIQMRVNAFEKHKEAMQRGDYTLILDLITQLRLAPEDSKA